MVEPILYALLRDQDGVYIDMNRLKDALNEQNIKLEDYLNRLVGSGDEPCLICPESGCIVLDFSNCSNFEILVTEDITCMRFVGSGAPGTIDFVIPPNVTRFITGFPDSWFPEGDEGSTPLVGGANGKTFGFRHNGTGGGSIGAGGATGGMGRPGVPQRRPASGGVPSGGGGGSCSCIPEKDQLTLVVCGKLNCGDTTPKFEVKACGGKPPYTWSDTADSLAQGVITGINDSQFSLRPPTNSGPAVAGTAYNKCGCIEDTFGCGGCETLSSCIISYGCDDVEDSNSCAAGTACTACSNSCTIVCSPVGCGGDGCVGGLTAKTRQSGNVIDKRTQAMKDDGCKPCVVEMAGKVVTVTDALGVSVSKTVVFSETQV